MSFEYFNPQPKKGKKPKAKPKRIRSKSRKMSPEEYAYSLKVKALGCIVREKARKIKDYCKGPIEYNHITDAGRRAKDENGTAHYNGFGACAGHHRTGRISIGRAKKTFEREYGTEEELVAEVRRRLSIRGATTEIPTSKIICSDYPRSVCRLVQH